MKDAMQNAGLGVEFEDTTIPTDWGDIEDERARVGGLVAHLCVAFCVVGLALVFVVAFGPA